MQRHTWRERTEEGLRFYRAKHYGGRWTMEFQMKGDEDWTPLDPPTVEEWRTLRDILWRKYQRKRCPWELIEKIDKMLEEAGGSEE